MCLKNYFLNFYLKKYKKCIRNTKRQRKITQFNTNLLKKI